MSRKYTSISQETTLSADLTDIATTATVVSGTNLLGGVTLTGGDTFTVVIEPETANEEIVFVTGVSTNTLTIDRAQDSTTAKAHSAGSKVRHMAIGQDFRLAEDHRNASASVHGLGAGANVVGTTSTQTLTNKTLTSPTINTASLTTASATGFVLTGNLNANNLKLVNLAAPTDDNDATRKIYVDGILGSATAAATSASAAAASEAAASASAAAASASAAAASASAVAAAASESAAAASASAASASAAAASASAVAADASAQAASASAVSAAADAAAASASAVAAAASYDDFDDRYLGAKSSDPTLDNDGDALITGALYFNTVINAMKVYNGAAWDVVAPDTSAFIQKTEVTAKGDLIAGTGNATIDNLAVGTNGYVLTASSSTTTGLAWSEVEEGLNAFLLMGA